MLAGRNLFLRGGTTVALVASYLQIGFVVAVLLLPIIPLNTSDGIVYGSILTLFQPPNPLLTYGLLSLEFAMVTLPSVLVISSIRKSKLASVRGYCLVAAFSGFLMTYMNWIFGYFFLPGALLMLMAALLLIFARLES
jgi:hypothetical protein